MKNYLINVGFFILVFAALAFVLHLLKDFLDKEPKQFPAVQINTTPCDIPLTWGAHYIAINDSTFVIYVPADTVICK